MKVGWVKIIQTIEVDPRPNERRGVDTGRGICFHSLCSWPGATHREC